MTPELKNQIEWALAGAASPTTAEALAREVLRLDALLNTPEFSDFIKAVPLEAAHQLERWGVEHDEGKTDADWLWLIAYLSSKALTNPIEPGDDIFEKRLHRIITIAAAASNWHAQTLAHSQGKSWPMRPGTAAPE